MPVRISNFRSRLIFSYLFIILAAFSLIVFQLDKALEGKFLDEIESSLFNQAYLVASQIPADNLKQENLAYLTSQVHNLSSKIKCRITIVDRQGRVLVDSGKTPKESSAMPNHADRPEIRKALSGTAAEESRYSTTLEMNMLYIALPVKEDGGRIAGAVRLSLPLANVEELLSVIKREIIFSLFLALGLALILGYILAAGLMKPVNKIIHASRRFSQGEFHHRILLNSEDEIGQLASTLNAMARSLEEKIKESAQQNQKLAAIFTSMIEGAIVTDRAGRIISANPAVERIFGVRSKNIEGRLFLEAIRNNDIWDIINAVLKKGDPASAEMTLNLPVQRIFKLNAVPVFDRDAVCGCLVVIHDISQIRKLETVRRDFVANVSHELKTPLTSIRGFVETLLEGALDDKANNRNFLIIIHEHAQRLDRLVNDLLSLSYLESREMKLEKADFNLYRLVEQVILNFKAQAEKRGLEIKNELPEQLMLAADKHKIEQVFINLIDNAVKFNSDSGLIRVYSHDLGDKIAIIVEDTGIGIPARDLPRIFERFYRVDKARSREMGGTGLGLSIVKHIVELHHGSVTVESNEGFGSKFSFIIPK